MMVTVLPVKPVSNSRPTAVLAVRAFLTHLEALDTVHLVPVVLAALQLQENVMAVILASVSMLMTQVVLLVVALLTLLEALMSVLPVTATVSSVTPTLETV